MIKRIILFITCFCCIIAVRAQDYNVTSVEYLKDDQSAREDIKTDENDRQCALFKISAQNISKELLEGFYFECDYASYIVQRIVKNNEIFLWVSPGIKTLKLKHDKLGPFDLHISKYLAGKVESLRTYGIVIQGVPQQTGGVYDNLVTEQYLLFLLTPPDAQIEVDNESWSVSEEGVAKKLVPFGTYQYKARARNYHLAAGTVEVKDPDDKTVVKVQLDSNFGWIEVPGTGRLEGANVYIDDIWVGEAPCKSNDLKSGEYPVKIEKSQFKTYNAIVEVKDNQTITVEPKLKKDKGLIFVLGNFSYSGAPQMSYGLTIGSTRQFGWYASVSSNFNFKNPDYECNANGIVSGMTTQYIITEPTLTRRMSYTAGMVFRAVAPIYIQLGGGYGYRNLYWTIDDGVNTYLAKDIDDSFAGFTMDAGLMLDLGGFTLSAGIQTINFQYLETKAGIGFSVKKL